MNWLITGGAGYIGAHVVRAMSAAGFNPVVFDDLSTGREAFVPAGVAFIRGSLLDGALIESSLRDFDVSGVIHLAGFKFAGVSVAQPLTTYAQNVEGTRLLLHAMQRSAVSQLVYSSSAAVYGQPDSDLVDEAAREQPNSPYGESKLIGEWLIRDVGVARAGTEGPFRHTSLRYFNVVGSGDPTVYDVSPHNLIPIVLEQLLRGEIPRINGDDYDTIDGTNVRDYVHVADVAAAHVAAAQRLSAGETLERAYNLGSGEGLSVRQVMESVARVTGIPFTPGIGPRRSGDPARIVASADLAQRDLSWENRYSVDQMIQTAWDARRRAV